MSFNSTAIADLTLFFERLRSFFRKLEAAVFPSFHSSQRLARKYLFDRLPAQPNLLENFIETDQAKVCREKLSQSDQDKILLIGRRGSGKTVSGLQIHRRYSFPDQDIKKAKIPVFVRLRNFKGNESAYQFFVSEISNSIRTKKGWLSWIASAMWLRYGTLLVILDDLDCLDTQRLRKLEQFIKKYDRHSFLCISSSKPKDEFWDQFECIELTNWRTTEAESYIYQRLSDRTVAKNLIAHLRQLRSIDQRFSALEWSQIVDAYVDKRTFELFHPSNISRQDTYSIWNNYVEIALKNKGVDWKDCVGKIGKIALTLLKEGRTNFRPSEVEVNADYLMTLIPAVLGKSDDHLYFSGDQYQVLVAGRYLALYWKEAEQELADDRSGIWQN
jgi:hypothetical protein